MPTYILGPVLAICVALFLEGGQWLTTDSSYFIISYFTKGAFLGLVLALVAGLYLRDAIHQKDKATFIISVVIFICTVLSVTITLKFILVGFLLHFLLMCRVPRIPTDFKIITGIMFVVMIAYPFQLAVPEQQAQIFGVAPYLLLAGIVYLFLQSHARFGKEGEVTLLRNFSLTMAAYLVYLDYINVGDQFFFI